MQEEKRIQEMEVEEMKREKGGIKEKKMDEYNGRGSGDGKESIGENGKQRRKREEKNKEKEDVERNEEKRKMS